MCGVAGWFTAHAHHDRARSQLRAMCDAIAHRGPDDEGYLVEPNVALGHRRLAIIAPEDGQQPMLTPDRDVAISYNGEAYNFRALRERLDGPAGGWRTGSDTEVVLALYRERGIAGFAELRGMYAFALWDARHRRGFLARDPYGIKPMFYTHTRTGRLAFASEAKALLALEEVDARLDPAALHRVMNFRYPLGGAGMLAGIAQLAPGEVIEWRPDGPARHHAIDARDDTDTPDLLDALEDSIRHHLVADTEVGVYLSGGIDSATVAALATRIARPAPRTFSLEVGDDPREADHAARTAQLLGLPNHRAGPGPIDHDRMRALIWHLEVPKINALQVSDVARVASGRVKVVLSGLGSDELFLGYNVHRVFALAVRAAAFLPRVLSRASAGALTRLSRLVPGPMWRESERAIAMLGHLGDWPAVYGQLRNVWDHPERRAAIYGPRMLEADLPVAREELAEAWPADPDPIAAMARFEWRNKMVDDLLWQEDRASMAEGLEVRVPFVDPAVAGCARRTPHAAHLGGRRGKGVLRAAVGTLLPPEVMARPKSGFQVDAPTFFRDNLANVARDLLSEHRVRELGLFNPGFVRDVLSRPATRGTRWHHFMLYLMLMTHLWVEVFEGAGASDA